MEVGAAIPQLAWNGHNKHTPNNTHHLTDNDIIHPSLVSSDYDGMTASDNSDSPPPLPTTLPPDYFKNGSNSSGLSSNQQLHSKSSGSPQDRVCHNVTTSEMVTQAKALSDGDSTSSSDGDMNKDEELDVLEQLKSSSTSKLIQLQQVQVTEDDKIDSREARTLHVSSSQNNAQVEILRLRKVEYITICASNGTYIHSWTCKHNGCS